MGSAKQRLEDYYRKFPDGLRQPKMPRPSNPQAPADTVGARLERPAATEAGDGDRNKALARK